MNDKLSFKDEKPKALLLGVKAIEWDNPSKNLFLLKRCHFKIHTLKY